MKYEELNFHGKLMKVEPSNTSMIELAKRIKKEETVFAMLEPGDGTRYNLCIVPCWSKNLRNELASMGVPSYAAPGYLWVSFMESGNGGFFALNRVQDFDLQQVRNPWTRMVISWWIRQLWATIEDMP